MGHQFLQEIKRLDILSVITRGTMRHWVISTEKRCSLNFHSSPASVLMSWMPWTPPRYVQEEARRWSSRNWLLVRGNGEASVIGVVEGWETTLLCWQQSSVSSCVRCSSIWPPGLLTWDEKPGCSLLQCWRQVQPRGSRGKDSGAEESHYWPDSTSKEVLIYLVPHKTYHLYINIQAVQSIQTSQWACEASGGRWGFKGVWGVARTWGI